MAEFNTYKISRRWFDFCFENPDLISTSHTAILFFAIEHCNRLGQKEKFGFPSQMACDAVGIKRVQTFIKYLDDLIEWGFIKMIQKSKNQWSSNVISINFAMPKNVGATVEASVKALDKAMLEHRDKQVLKQMSYNKTTKQLNNLTTKQLNNTASQNFESENEVETEKNIEQRKIDFFNQVGLQFSTQYANSMLNEFCEYWAEHNPNGKKMRFEMEKVFDISRRLKTWSNNNFKSNKNGTSTKSKLEQTQDALQRAYADIDAKYASKDVR